MKSLKEKIKKEFYQGINRKGFYSIVTVKDQDGKEYRILRGLLEAGLRAVRRHQGEIIRAADAGKRFGQAKAK
jgi:hypothetical protein